MHKMSLLWLAAVAALVGLAGCSALVLQPQMRACYFPDSAGAVAPSWVCDARLPGVALSAVGAASASAGAYTEQKAMAIRQARGQLVQRARDELFNQVSAYARHQAGSVPGEEARIAYSIRRYFRPGMLDGARVYRTAVSPRGALYVLLGLNERAAQARMRDALSASLGADAGLWQRYLPGHALSRLPQQILRTP